MTEYTRTRLFHLFCHLWSINDRCRLNFYGSDWFLSPNDTLWRQERELQGVWSCGYLCERFQHKSSQLHGTKRTETIMAEGGAVPVIDLQQLPFPYTKLREACQEWGCFRVVNHGVPVMLMSEMKMAARSLLDLPIETKNRNEEVRPGSGYIALGKWTLFMSHSASTTLLPLRLHRPSAPSWMPVPSRGPVFPISLTAIYTIHTPWDVPSSAPHAV